MDNCKNGIVPDTTINQFKRPSAGSSLIMVLTKFILLQMKKLTTTIVSSRLY